MNANSPHAKAARAEANILYALHRYGYLTASQVAALVYPHLNQAVIMARRTLLRMSERKLVLVKRGETVYSEQHYALSTNGARVLYEHHGINARSGKDLLRIISPHRDAANWCAIRLNRESYFSQVWTEREIQIKRKQYHQACGKVPDFLGCNKDGECSWGEVEACRRGGRDMKALALWLVNDAFPGGYNAPQVSIDPPRDSLHLSEVRFVIASTAAGTFAKRLARALKDHGQVEDVTRWAESQLQFQLGFELDAPLVTGFSGPTAV